MTAKFSSPLNNIKVASPCSQDWNAMIGNDRKRYCGDCKLNVYNLSGMTKNEAENLILNSEGRLCVRFYRRADGSVLTQDCPVGWRAIKQRVSKTVTAFASVIFGLIGGLGFHAAFNQTEVKTEKRFLPVLQTPFGSMVGEMLIEEEPEEEVMGKPVMGDIAPENIPTTGIMLVPQETKRNIKRNPRR
jgi:hypothetical protein